MGGMNTDWLSQLAPAHAPPPPGWWPPAPGWWLAALLALVAAALIALWRHRPAQRLKRAALRELRQIEQTGADVTALARQLELLLRRYAVARYGREAVARLSGERWIAFVAAHGGTALSGTVGLDLLRSAYRGGGDGASRSLWLSGARGFLRARR